MKCGNCGAENLDSMALCTVCGAVLSAAEATAPAPYSPAPPDPYGAAPAPYSPAPPDPYGAAPQSYSDPQAAAMSYPPPPSAPAASMACGNCGKPFGPGEINCTNCGAPISMGRPAAPPAKKKTPMGLLIGIISGVVVIAALLIVMLVVIPGNNYNKAVDLFNSQNYVEAVEAFDKLGNFKDSADYAELCRQHILYNEALSDMEAGEYDKAREKFLSLGDFEDSKSLAEDCTLWVKYYKAVDLYNQGQYEDAYYAFLALGSFKDSAERAKNCIQPEPPDGILQEGPAYDEGEVTCALVVINTQNFGLIVTVFDKDDRFWGSVWVSAYATTPKMAILPGEYRFGTIEGELWFGPELLFGADTETYNLTFAGEDYLTFNEGFYKEIKI